MRRGLAWLLAVGCAAVALQWAGAGPLVGPPLSDPSRWGIWLEGRDPVVAAFSLLRLAAVAGLWYLAVVTAIGAALRMVGAARLVRVADRVTIGPVRRMLAGGISLGLAASGVVTGAAPALAQPSPSSTTTTTVAAASAVVTMHRLGPADTAPAAPVPEVGPTVADRWTVKPGQCFWSIAEAVLTERWGRAPSDAEIVPYWRRLIDANRHELAHGDNPDLVFPGQVFQVPAP